HEFIVVAFDYCRWPRSDGLHSYHFRLYRIIQTTSSHSADLAWTTTDHDGRQTTVVRSHLPASGFADHRAAALPTKCESACRSLHGRWTRLYRFCLAARRTIA